MAQSIDEIFGQIGQLLRVWDELFDELGEGLPLSQVFETAQTDNSIASCKLLKCLDALPEARKVDNRRFMASNGLDERIKLLDMSDQQRALVLEKYNG